MNIKIFLLLILISASLLGNNKKNPDSKLYVADVSGESLHQTEDGIEDVSKKEVFTASKTFIETKKKSNSAMVYSNATGIFFDEETRLDIEKFVQEPFRPDRNDYEIEPSVSNTDGRLRYGRIAICTPKLVAGSKMSYSSHNATANIRRGKMVMEASENETRFYLFDGNASIKAIGLNLPDEDLKKGQMAIIKNGGLSISDIPPELKNKEKLTDMACAARKQVYFDVKQTFTSDAAGATNQENQIVAVEIVPLDLPKNFTISPAKLD